MMRRAAITALFALSSEGVADPLQSVANQRNMLPGDRAALMGGAYTALSDDASGSYYNPAGLAFVGRDRIEASATAYRTTELIYKETVNEEPFDERSATIYPSFIGGTSRLSKLVLSYSFITLDARNIYQQNKYGDISSAPGAASSYSRTYQETSTYIWAGGSAALPLAGGWSIGASVFYYQRNIEFTTAEQVQLNGGGVATVNDTMKTLNTGLAGVYGLMYRNDVFSLGASARLANALSDHSILLQDEIYYDPTATSGEGSDVPTVTNTTIKYKALNEMNPATYSLGVAWFALPGVTLATDVLVHEGVKSRFKSRGGQDLHTTMNMSAGVLGQFGPVHLMAGWFTNNSMYRAPDPERTDQPTAVNYRGHAYGVGWSGGVLDGQLGYVRQDGTGKSQIRGGVSDVQEVEGNIQTYLISGKVPL